MLEGIEVCGRGLMDRIFSKKNNPDLAAGVGEYLVDCKLSVHADQKLGIVSGSFHTL